MDNDEVCSVCFSTSMALQNGVLVCMVCGTQSQNFVEEAMDMDEQEAGTRANVRRIRVAKTKPSKDAEDSDQSKVERIPKIYCTCLQEGLFALCRFLQQEHGLDDCVFAITKTIWLAVVARSGLLEPGATALKRRTRALATAELDDAEGSQEINYHLRYHREAVWNLLPPEAVLCVLHLMCIRAKTAISPMDLVGQAFSGEFPLQKELHDASMRHDPDRTLRLWKYLTVTGMEGPQLLSYRAAEVARDLSLGLPTLNAEALLQRYCLDLELPMELCAGAMALLEVYQAAGLLLKLELDTLYHDPYTQLMSLLVFTAHQRLQIAAGVGSEWENFDWLLWARKVVRKLSVRHPPGFQVDGRVFPDSQEAYAILSQKLYSANPIPQLLEDFERALGKLDCPHSYDPILPTPAAGGISEETMKEADFSSLLTAASAVGGFMPYILRRHVDMITPEMLKVERVAAKVGIADPGKHLHDDFDSLRSRKLIVHGMSKAAP